MAEAAFFTKDSRLARPLRRFTFLWRGRKAAACRHNRPGSLESLRDSGARRETQDYVAAAAIDAGSPRRLHRLAEAVSWSLPRL